MVKVLNHEKIKALKNLIGVENSVVYSPGTDIYEVPEYDTEYKVLTDEEADDLAYEKIVESLWAFNAEFIVEHSILENKFGVKEIEAIRLVQGSLCENANDFIKALIEDIDEFVEDAIEIDGRGHFISSYDGEEIEQDDYYIYRIN